jgi:NAD(P)-dependent dehydrogenase (short-subunit alcohol dehydrogenase family)
VVTRFEGKVAIVTGSGQGIGQGLAVYLADHGAHVVTNSRSSTNSDGTTTASDTAAQIEQSGGRATAVFADVGTMAGCSKVVDAAMEITGRVDILINNAGWSGPVRPVGELTGDEWTETLNVNLTSQFGCCHFAVPAMLDAGWGRVVNVSSNVGLFGLGQMTPYAAAKAGSLGLTFALAHECAGTGITVNALLPTSSTIRTERSRAERQLRTGHTVTPSALRSPEAIAPLVGYLCSNVSDGISGQVFYAAGGQITHYSWPPPARTLLKPGGHWTMDELEAALPSYFGTVRAALPPPAPLS